MNAMASVVWLAALIAVAQATAAPDAAASESGRTGVPMPSTTRIFCSCGALSISANDGPNATNAIKPTTLSIPSNGRNLCSLRSLSSPNATNAIAPTTLSSPSNRRIFCTRRSLSISANDGPKATNAIAPTTLSIP
ncbi:hypothetical protein DIPPA_12379 [Diplonema papillatum]|nr:hypothetical protein DIPPA_12379 [Diplonema papillatum]